MFQFSHLPPLLRTVSRHYPGGVAPFGNLRLRVPASNRSFSQLGYALLRLLMPRHPPSALTCFLPPLSPSLGFLSPSIPKGIIELKATVKKILYGYSVTNLTRFDIRFLKCFSLRLPRFLTRLFIQKQDGGAEEARTPDFLLAKEALSQLSYSPV